MGMKPLPAETASHFMVFVPYFIETKKDGFCEVKLYGVEGYSGICVVAPDRNDLWVLETYLFDDVRQHFSFLGTEYNKTWRVWPDQPSIEDSREAFWEG